MGNDKIVIEMLRSVLIASNKEWASEEDDMVIITAACDILKATLENIDDDLEIEGRRLDFIEEISMKMHLDDNEGILQAAKDYALNN